MLLADVMMWFLLVLGVLFSFPALWLLSRGLYSQDVEVMASYLETSRVRAFFSGLPVTLVCVFGVALFVDKHQAFCDIAVVSFLAFFLFYSNVGVAALATMIGNKLPSPADQGRPWKSTIRGGVVLELSYLLPVLGWFFILPISLIVGAGAVTARIFSKRKAKGKDSQIPMSPTSSGKIAPDKREMTDADEVVGAA